MNQLLKDILKELKKLELYLELMDDTTIKETEVS